MLIGLTPEKIDADIFRNNVQRVISKTNSFVAGKIANAPDLQESIKGYATPDKLKSVFEQNATGTTEMGYAGFAERLQGTLEPFTRSKDTIGNINQAMLDLVNMAINQPYSEANMNRVIDVCSGTYVHEKADGMAQEDAQGKRAMAIIAGLLDVFEIHFKEYYSANTKEQYEQAHKDFASFMETVRGFVSEDAPKRVVSLQERRPGGAATG